MLALGGKEVGVPGDNSRKPTALRARQNRNKVSDDILAAFHFACDTKDFEIAQRLLIVVEDMLLDKVDMLPNERKRALSPIVAAHERIWSLRHPEER